MGNCADRTSEKRNTAQKDLGNKDLENRSKTEMKGRSYNVGKTWKSSNTRRKKEIKMPHDAGKRHHIKMKRP